VAGSCKYGDELSGSGTTELAILKIIKLLQIIYFFK
jgi:hypothetical protein